MNVKMSLCGVCVAAVCGFVGQVRGQGKPAEVAAKSGDATAFVYRQEKLSNGLAVVTLEDFSCPVVSVQLWYHVGSKNEDPERQGFAHMFEHMMFRGTDKLGPTDHFDFIRKVGGTCNAYTNFDQTVYHEELPSSQLELALFLESERMAFLKIDQAAFDTERKVVEEERRLGVNRPYGTVLEKVLPQLFKSHPYRWSVIGSIPHLRAASVPELRAFWNKWYVPNNATLVIAGAVKHEEAQSLAKKYFGWIPAYEQPENVKDLEPEQTAANAFSVKEDSAPAPVVGIAFKTGVMNNPDNEALEYIASILGGGQSARLYREMVAEKQMAVFAGGGAFSLEQEGIVGFGAALPPFGGDSKKAMAAMEAQIARIRDEPVTDDEMTKARNTLLAQEIGKRLTVASKASALGEAAVLRGDIDYVNTRVAKLRAVTAADVQRVARKYLTPERMNKLTVERNLLGSLFGKKKGEDDAPITGIPETSPPPPGRTGLSRPAERSATAPVNKVEVGDITPRFETRTLANGMKVMVVTNREVPYASVQLGIKNGAWTEKNRGAASMAMAMLTKGTASRSEAQMAHDLEFAAINLNGYADMDSASISMGCVTDQLDRAFDLIGDAVCNPAFDANEFGKLRKQMRAGMVISQASPEYLAEREMRTRLYGAHPYARDASGEIADVDALTVDDCKAWWSEFAHPETAVLVCSGDIDADRAVKLAETAFKDWKAGKGASAENGGSGGAAVPTQAIPAAAPTHIYLVDKPGVQSQIRVAQIGIKRSDPDYFAARVMSGYFGGAFNSRVNETIRVKKGLTYGASGGFSAQRFAGAFQVSTFSKTATTAAAVEAIFDELARLHAEAPSAKELGDTQSYMLGSFVAQRETPQAVAGDLWMLELNNLPADYYNQMLRAVSATDAARCIEVAKGHVDPSKMVVVVVGSAAAIKADLEKIAPVTVVMPVEAKEAKGDAKIESKEPPK